MKAGDLVKIKKNFLYPDETNIGMIVEIYHHSSPSLEWCGTIKNCVIFWEGQFITTSCNNLTKIRK